MPRPLRDYQKKAFHYGIKTEHPAYFMQMRLGKTIVCIRVNKYQKNERILVVAPYSALYGWKRELTLEGMDQYGVLSLEGTGEQRKLQLGQGFENNKWTLVNKEIYLSVPDLAHYPFDSVILDESTFIKTPENRCKATKFFCTNFRKAKHRSVLTGSPAPESEINYFQQLRFLDHTKWNEKNYWQFEKKYFCNHGFKDYISPKGSEYLKEKLARNCFFLSRHDVKLGGEKIFETRLCKMTDKVRKIYTRAEKEMVLEWGGGRHDTIFATTKHTWLRRLCGGFADQEFISYAKIYELEHLLRTELKDEKTVIICKHTNEVEKAAKYLSKFYKVEYIHGKVKKSKREEIQDKFLNGKLDHVVAQPSTIAYGVDLSISDTIVVYSAPDSGLIWMQVQDRIVNTATNDTSLILFLAMAGTVEEDRILELEGKVSQQDALISSVKRLQNKYNLQ